MNFGIADENESAVTCSNVTQCWALPGARFNVWTQRLSRTGFEASKSCLWSDLEGDGNGSPVWGDSDCRETLNVVARHGRADNRMNLRIDVFCQHETLEVTLKPVWWECSGHVLASQPHSPGEAMLQTSDTSRLPLAALPEPRSPTPRIGQTSPHFPPLLVSA